MSALLNGMGYFGSSMLHSTDASCRGCPSCGCAESTIVERKWKVTAPRRCARCRLMFRTPTRHCDEDRRSYAPRYQQPYTTDVPNEERFRELISHKFAPIEKRYERFSGTMTAFGGSPRRRLLDFSCSWSYGSWLIAQNGFVVDSFELPGSRATCVRERLSVNVLTSIAATPHASYDIFFPSLVLEQVPNASRAIRNWVKLVRAGGLLFAFVSNGSIARREARAASWSKSWGLGYSNFLYEHCATNRFSAAPAYLASDPDHVSRLPEWRDKGMCITDVLRGEELLVVARSVAAS